MKPFTLLRAIAAPLPVSNIDTDKIIGAAYLKTISKTGLGAGLFETWRRTPDGDEIAEFILNRMPWREAQVLVALDNFGCGSSREHAPWALLDFGIRVIVAPSIADIFYGNCIKNGMLPIELPHDDVEAVLKEIAKADGARVEIDLPSQTVTLANGRCLHFDIGPAAKDALMQGIDEIARTLSFADRIAAFESNCNFNPQIKIEPNQEQAR